MTAEALGYQPIRKLVYEYTTGGYYRWCGESRYGGVKHITKNIHDADDHSEYAVPEEPRAAHTSGKFVWYTVSYDKDRDFVKGENDVDTTE
jgi:hypothetical protein